MSPRAKKPKTKVVEPPTRDEYLDGILQRVPDPLPPAAPALPIGETTSGEIRAAIERAIAEVDFDEHQLLDYCARLRARILELLPRAGVEVYHWWKGVSVTATIGPRVVRVDTPFP